MKNYKNKNTAYSSLVRGMLAEPMAVYGYEGRRCLYCYGPLHEEHTYFHQACSHRFFGQAYVPKFEYDKGALESLARQFVNSKMAVTGVQPKVSLSWHRKQEKNAVKKLTIVGLYGDYILKPPSDHYRALPELEDCTMKMADVCGLKTVPHTLFALPDATLCYLTKRVDRTRQGMRHMEDFCQLTERLTEDKYKGSHEQVAKAIMRYSAAPLLDVGNFYEYVLFSFFTGNADMHLKNFSLLETDELGQYMLCPAYDMLCTALVNKADKEELALSLNGKKSKLNYNDFLTAYNLAGLSKKVLDKTLENFYYCSLEMKTVVQKCFLPTDMKDEYTALVDSRFRRLGLY
jgi:serine/threonine-protein kinase HipA